jgi:hypothetical protein
MQNVRPLRFSITHHPQTALEQKLGAGNAVGLVKTQLYEDMRALQISNPNQSTRPVAHPRLADVGGVKIDSVENVLAHQREKAWKLPRPDKGIRGTDGKTNQSLLQTWCACACAYACVRLYRYHVLVSWTRRFIVGELRFS